MTRKTTSKSPKLSDEARHERFVDMAREVEAVDSADAFDRAFDEVVSPPKTKE